MKWNTGTIRSLEERIPIDNQDKPQFAHYSIVEDIMRQARKAGDIPAGETMQLHFLCTFKDSKFAHLIIHQDEIRMGEFDGDMVRSLNNEPLRLELGKSHSFLIRFEGQDRGKRYTVDLNAYDDVQIH